MPVANASVKAYACEKCANTCDILDASSYVTLDQYNKPSSYPAKAAKLGAKSIYQTYTVGGTTTNVCFNLSATWGTKAATASNVPNPTEAAGYGECWSGADCKGLVISTTPRHNNDAAAYGKICDLQLGGDSVALVETKNGTTAKNCYNVALSTALTQTTVGSSALDEATNPVDVGELELELEAAAVTPGTGGPGQSCASEAEGEGETDGELEAEEACELLAAELAAGLGLEAATAGLEAEAC
eukprot:tig00021312_g20069.t1